MPKPGGSEEEGGAGGEGGRARPARRPLAPSYLASSSMACDSVGCVVPSLNACVFTSTVSASRASSSGLSGTSVRLGEWKARLLANPTLLSEAYLARGLAAA